MGVFFSASGHHPPAYHQPSFLPAQPQPQDGRRHDTDRGRSLDRRAQCVHTSAHELITLRCSPTATPYSSKQRPLHNAKSRTRLFSINATLVVGGWIPHRKWPFSVGSVLSSLLFLACVSQPFRNNRGFRAAALTNAILPSKRGRARVRQYCK